MAQTISGARLLVQCLEQHDVEYIFGIPGAKIDAVFDALLDSSIQVILCRHEQNATFMAAIYGRLTGKPGVVLVTSGPGISNLATGLLTATTEGDPVIAIGGNVPLAMKLKSSHQNTDNLKLMEAVTKARMEVLVPSTIPEIVENAFRIASTPRSGAVFISFPQDVSLQVVDNILVKTPPAFFQQIIASPASTQAIAQSILSAKHPVLLLGLEASRPQNSAAIRNLLSQTAFPVVCTYQGAGVISHDLLPCFAGRVGLFKNQPGDKLLDASDCIITIGFNSVEYDPEIWNTRCDKKILHIDYNPAEIHASYTPTLELLGDIASNLALLKQQLPTRAIAPPFTPVHQYQKELMDMIQTGAHFHGNTIHPLRFIYELQKITTDSTYVISDIGSHYMWIARYFLCFQPHHLLMSNGQQTLGVALPWAIATSKLYPKDRVISISGDGGFLFSATELETAVREKVHFIHFVWCDGSYNMVQEQEMLKYHRESAVRFGPVNIVTFAESFGAVGFCVRHADQLEEIIQKALKTPGPVLIEVPIDYSDNAALFQSSHEGLIH